MKLKDLLEMAPYHGKGEKPPAHWKKTLEMFFSDNAVTRDFTLLGKFELEYAIHSIQEVNLIIRNEGRMLYGVYKAVNKYNENGWKVVFVLEFKSKPTLLAYARDINKKFLLQVNKVNTEKDFRDLGLAMFSYQLMISKGFTILSDTTQLDGGVALWKKLARRSIKENYKIRIIDDERGYLKRNGKVVEYDGHNIDDAEIWTTGMDFSGEHTLLIMSLKK